MAIAVAWGAGSVASPSRTIPKGWSPGPTRSCPGGGGRGARYVGLRPPTRPALQNPGPGPVTEHPGPYAQPRHRREGWRRPTWATGVTTHHVGARSPPEGNMRISSLVLTMRTLPVRLGRTPGLQTRTGGMPGVSRRPWAGRPVPGRRASRPRRPGRRTRRGALRPRRPALRQIWLPRRAPLSISIDDAAPGTPVPETCRTLWISKIHAHPGLHAR
jgi:hypothetical protein